MFRLIYGTSLEYSGTKRVYLAYSATNKKLILHCETWCSLIANDYYAVFICILILNNHYES